MFNYEITFAQPWYGLLAAPLPLLWWLSFRSLSGLGHFRRMTALVLRTLVVLLLIIALAEIQLVRKSERLTVIFLVDQSRSIPQAQREAMRQYVERASGQRRNETEDRFGVIYFARSAKPDVVPIDEAAPLSTLSEIDADQDFDRSFTNLALAMRQAQATFPEDGAKRIVIITDGNENQGDAARQAQSLSESGIGIDVVPIRLRAQSEVSVEKISTSSDVRRGQPFDLRVVINASIVGEGETLSGRLKILRKMGGQTEELNPGEAQQRVTLLPGKNVFTFRETIEAPDFYSYEARFFPEQPGDDGMSRNNRATTFTHVRGRGQVLLIRDWNREEKFAGEFDTLVERLRKEDIEVTVRGSNQLFNDLAELQRFDAVVLANVPRSSGSDGGNITSFSDRQISMLVRNTQQLGSGLVMIGGQNSFGAGGWAGTEIEKAMPVDFHIKNAKVKAVGALAMIMHASEIARANFWQRKIAQEAIKALGPEDFCGLIHWNGNDVWLWKHAQGGMVKVGGNRQHMLARLDRMTPGDMPDFDPSIRRALKSLVTIRQAAVKHMIIVSDGDPSPASNNVLQRCKAAGIKISTVAVGGHGQFGHPELKRIANITSGKYYVVKNNNALPKIYQQEVRRISRSLVYERPTGLVPIINYRHEMLKGIEEPIPPITGFVLTTVKEQAEVALISPLPPGDRNNTILAGWVYGAGKTVALTTDAGDTWASSWTRWESYDKLFSQIIRWAMRPTGQTANFSVATDVSDGKTQIVVTALDKQNELLNYLDLTGVVIGPDLKPQTVKIRQTAPGRYVGEFDSEDAGSYLINVMPGGDNAPIRTGVNVPYSSEFRDRQTNQTLLTQLVASKPAGGAKGQLIEDVSGQGQLDAMLAVDAFRHDLAKATSRQDIWHLMALIGGCLFFFDVFIRRVAVSFGWAGPLAARARNFVMRREVEAEEPQYLSRLRGRKAEVVDEIEERRAAARFEPAADANLDVDPLGQKPGDLVSPSTENKKKPTGLAPGEQEEDDFTSRLKKAKQKAQDQHKRSDDNPFRND